MQGKQFTAISCRSSTLIFSFSSISQVFRRRKQKIRAAKTSFHKKQAMLFAKCMHLLNPFDTKVLLYTPLEISTFRKYGKGTLAQD